MSRASVVVGDARPLTSAIAHHGEGAYWDSTAGVLRMVDMLRGDVLSIEGQSVSRVHLDDVAALIRRRKDGGYVIAVERGFLLTDSNLSPQQRIPAFDDTALRLNEGTCDARGRLYCGSMAYDMSRGSGALYRLDPDLSVTVVIDSVSIPNGLLWAHDGALALHADTLDRRITAYEVDRESGMFGASQVFADFTDLPGSPDGMTMDIDGGIWAALWGGGAVVRLDSEGNTTDLIELPTTNPTSVCFGGPEGSTLFVTTSQELIEPGTEPLAGAVFSIPTTTRGVPLEPFAG